MEFYNHVSDSVAKLIYIGEPDMLPKTYNEVEYLKVQTKKTHTNHFRSSLNQKKTVKDSLQQTIKTGLKDVVDDLNIDLEIELE